MVKKEFAIAALTFGVTNAAVKNMMQQMGVSDPHEALRLFNSGEWGLVQKERPIESVQDLTITPDRSKLPIYPDKTTLMHPELQCTGPATYTMDQFVWWLHPKQTGHHVVTGHRIYDSLQEDDCFLLKSCLGLEDLEAIQKKGIKAFQKAFKRKTAVYGWKAVIRRQYGSLYVPFLIGRGGKVALHWDSLDSRWNSNDPAFCLA